MTNEEKIKIINKIVKHRHDIDGFGNAFISLFGSFPGDGKCGFECFERLFSDYMQLVADKIGESEDGLDWFIWENKCGAKKLGAYVKHDGDETIIDSVESYVDFLNDCAKQNSVHDKAVLYEKLRRMNPREFSELHRKNIEGEGAFDDLLAKWPE